MRRRALEFVMKIAILSQIKKDKEALIEEFIELNENFLKALISPRNQRLENWITPNPQRWLPARQLCR